MSEEARVVAFVGVGSNVDPERNIIEALRRLRDLVAVRSVSTFYRTPALGRPEQPDFLNGACEIETALSARDLKYDVLRRVEEALGRVRTGDKYQARCIDLDVLVFGEGVVNSGDLILPDPEIRERPFIAIPLLELAPHLVLADTGERLEDLESAKTPHGLVPDEAFTEKLRMRVPA